MCAHLLCAAHPRWQVQGNCDAFRVSTATRSVVSILSFEAQCCPCLKHLRCGLVCEATQTALDEIRLDEHDWSQTSNLRSLLVSVAQTSDTWPRLKRISTMLASLTYFISAWNIKQSVIHGEGEEVRLSLLF